MSLYSLPIELLEYICTFLSSSSNPTKLDDTGELITGRYRASLQSFSLVNHKCHAAALPVLYRSITFDAYKPEDTLQQRAGDLANVLESVGTKHVRELIIIDTRSPHATKYGDHHDWIMSEHDAELEILSSAPIHYQGEQPDAIQDDATWFALSQLIERLYSLCDLVWNCPAHIPACMLRVLKQRGPNLRLHLRTLCLEGNALAAKQYAMDISPFLTTVWLCVAPDSLDDFSPSVKTFLEMIASKAPRLRDIRCNFETGNTPLMFLQNIELERYSQPSFLSKSLRSVQGRCQLERLDLDAFGTITPEYLEMWMEFNDFSSLGTLHLRGPRDDTLPWLASLQPFQALHTLILTSDRHLEQDQEYHENSNAFLASVPSLRALRIAGHYNNDIIQTIGKTHGTSLRQLWLNPNNAHVFDLGSIRSLRAHCSHLESIRITVRRNKGNIDETNIYRVLGSFPSLKTLLLTLDCSNPSLLIPLHDYETEEEEDDSGDEDDDNDHDENDDQGDGASEIQEVELTVEQSEAEQDEQEAVGSPNLPADLYPPGLTASYPLTNRPTKNDIRNSLINAAIDSSLAQEIYNTVSSSKSPSSPALSHLIIHPIKAGTFANVSTLPGLPECFSEISKTWDIRRSWDGQVQVKGDESLAPWKKSMRLQSALKEIFEDIWPDQGTGDWRTEWSSFPLSHEKGEMYSS